MSKSFRNALDPARLQRWIETEVSVGATVRDLTPEYVRWKERDGSLVGWRVVVLNEGREHRTYVTVRHADPARLEDEASKLAHRALETYAGLRAWTLLPRDELLLLAFPLDRDIPDLRRLVRASKMRSLIEARFPHYLRNGLHVSKSRSRCEAKRYKPERRAVLSWDLALVDSGGTERDRLPLWVRLYADATARACAEASRAAAAAGIRAPEALAILHDRLLVESHLEGTPWTIGVDAEDAASARTLARVHRTPPPTGLPTKGVTEEIDLVLRAVDDVARLDAETGAVAAAIADELVRTVPAPGALVFCHGDFHPGQVLIHGEDAGLCDFDRACVAPAASDLATLHAHCVVADPVSGARQALRFREHYDRYADEPTRSELAWWRGCALVRAATTPFRKMREDWPSRTRGLLSAAAIEARGRNGGVSR
ncbi:phosphotransferase family protein [Congregicoccus parvus]|uniref:phosphotransferase family protein n=1 Tax=Congregicoccus parvus TaxID=3081749 RepID=UPI003FA5CEDB